MKHIYTTLLLLASFLLSICSARADFLHIKYRSGNVQTIRLTEPSSSITSISYIEDRTSLTDPKGHQQSQTGSKWPDNSNDSTPGNRNYESPSNGGPGIRMEWVKPLDEQ